MNAPDPIDTQAAVDGETYAADTASGARAQQRVHRPLDAADQAARRRLSRRANFIKWLRKVHGWVGLWGAALGLMFGVTGFLLNHRGAPLKVSSGAPQVEDIQVAVPREPLRSPAEMARWLQRELKIAGKPGHVTREPAHPVAWGDQGTVQPELWKFGIFGTTQSVQAEYWVGNGFIAVKRTQHAFLTTLNNLHRGVGMSVGWVLLIDTIAGGMILLSLTGVLLWTELNKRRVVGVILVTGSLVAAVVCGLM